MKSKIEGVSLKKLKQFHDERGKVMHMLKVTDSNFHKFGEIYFSCTYPNVVKAWHKHSEMTLNYACIVGGVKVVLYDNRIDSSSRGIIEEHYLSPENYYLLCVPPHIWNGFKGLNKGYSIIANCLNLPHNEKEMVREDHNSSKFKYNW